MSEEVPFAIIYQQYRLSTVHLRIENFYLQTIVYKHHCTQIEN